MDDGKWNKLELNDSWINLNTTWDVDKQLDKVKDWIIKETVERIIEQ
jgi:hypothetical protein